MTVSALDTLTQTPGWQDQQEASGDVTQTYELREEKPEEAVEEGAKEVTEEEKDSSESA